MIRRIAVVVLFALVPVGSVVASAVPSDDFLAALGAARADVRWDRNSVVARDFDGDGKADFAVVGYVGAGLVVATRVSKDAKPSDIQYVSFGIGNAQDSICTAPAHLVWTPLVCDINGTRLPGCDESRGVSGLTLSDRDGDCDPINLYWDHTQHRMGWWRN